MSNYQLLLPKMGESVAEATVIKWLKNPGDYVEADEAVLEIATDKVDSEVPSPVAGKLITQLYMVDDVVQVGSPIALIQTQEQAASQAPVPETVQSPSVAQPAVQQAPPAVSYDAPPQPVSAPQAQSPVEPQSIPGIDQLQTKPAAIQSSAGRFYSPLVKSIAAQEGIAANELDTIPGTGAEGRLTKDDLLNYLQNRNKPQAQASAPAPQAAPPVVQSESVVPAQATVVSASPAPQPQAAPVQQAEAPQQQQAPLQQAPPAQTIAQPQAPQVTAAPIVQPPAAPQYEQPVQQQQPVYAQQQPPAYMPPPQPVYQQPPYVVYQQPPQQIFVQPPAYQTPSPVYIQAPQYQAPEYIPQPQPQQPKKQGGNGVSIGAEDEIIEMDRMRRLIADHMVNSKQTSPHVTSFIEADVTNLVMWREKVKQQFEKREGEKLTFTPIFVQAVANAIKALPMINVSVDGTNIIKRKHINIGMATALPSGNLIVPVIKKADELSLTGLAKAVNDLADRARKNKLKPEEIKDGTFTITNVGTFGNVMGTPIINQPQVAILALGAIKKKPAVVETKSGDVITIRHMMYLSLSYDHRVVDGALGGMFIKRVTDYLEAWDINKEL